MSLFTKNNKMAISFIKKRIIILVIFIIFFIAGFIYQSRLIYEPMLILENSAGIAEVKINEDIFTVFIADDAKEKRRGLIGHKSLSKNSGMLFIFDSPSIPHFWMKDMQFSIDIIWIYQNQIIGWSENALPQPSVLSDELVIYYPPSLVNMVLEVAAGTVRESDMRIGDMVIINYK